MLFKDAKSSNLLFKDVEGFKLLKLTRRCTTVRNSDDQAIPLRWARTPISI